MENFRRRLPFGGSNTYKITAGANKMVPPGPTQSQFHVHLPNSFQTGFQDLMLFINKYMETLNSLTGAGSRLADKFVDMLMNSSFQETAGQFHKCATELSHHEGNYSARCQKRLETEIHNLSSKLKGQDDMDRNSENIQVVANILGICVELQMSIYRKAGMLCDILSESMARLGCSQGGATGNQSQFTMYMDRTPDPLQGQMYCGYDMGMISGALGSGTVPKHRANLLAMSQNRGSRSLVTDEELQNVIDLLSGCGSSGGMQPTAAPFPAAFEGCLWTPQRPLQTSASDRTHQNRDVGRPQVADVGRRTWPNSGQRQYELFGSQAISMTDTTDMNETDQAEFRKYCDSIKARTGTLDSPWAVGLSDNVWGAQSGGDIIAQGQTGINVHTETDSEGDGARNDRRRRHSSSGGLPSDAACIVSRKETDLTKKESKPITTWPPKQIWAKQGGSSATHQNHDNVWKDPGNLPPDRGGEGL